MELIRDIEEMRHWSRRRRRSEQRIALVPTMGYLHAGHLRLIAEARRRTDACIVSIFVNPTQFGPGEDLDAYPRDLERDRRLTAEAGTDALFVPDAAQMYPPGFQTHTEVEQLTQGLCGAGRPGHFRGVATVVSKLFHITEPDVAVFGEKDFQQLTTIRRMVRDLDFAIEVVGVPTAREADGLALSSRNAYLGPSERRAALAIPRALEAVRQLVARGEQDGLRLLAEGRRVLNEESKLRTEYLVLSEPETLREVERIDGPTLLAVAARIGGTRLIDNCILEGAPGRRPALAPTGGGITDEHEGES